MSLLNWLDDRTGFRAVRRYVLDEPLPPGTGWWFTLGSVLLFGLAVQVVTGVALALYYAPTPDHAWDSVRFITTELRAGQFVRGLHYWGASVVVVAALLHLLRVVLFGSYRKPREANWIVGLILLQIILAFGLTGYLLPWDQRAYWATVVTINIAKVTPAIGEWVASLLRGGPDIGALTLMRWYAMHVLVLPALLVSLVGAHLYLLRRHGISGPAIPRAGAPRSFFPEQAARDLAVAAMAAIVLVALAWKGAPALEPPADPTASAYSPRPEWYFLGLFQLLKYFPGKLEVVGALIVPGAAMLALFLLPWLDRSRTRHWRDRRLIVGAVGLGAVVIGTLTTLGALDHPARSATGWNVRELAGAALIGGGDRCARCHRGSPIAHPIEPGRIAKPQDWLAMHIVDPEVIAAGIRPPPETNEYDLMAILAALARMRNSAPPVVDAAEQSVDVLVNRHCLKCHVIDGIGGDEGPALSHAGKKLDAATIAKRIAHPKEVKPDSEMTAFADKLSPDEIRSIAEWLARKK